MIATDIVDAVDHAVRELLRAHPRLVLAISGGSDSMALLTAVANARSATSHVVVATFDHGTGPSARAAVSLVRQSASDLGFTVRVGRAIALPKREASWRTARWQFLRRVAADECATIVTAHTEDDHVETVVMRVLRAAGARGLAGLLANSDIARPLVGFTRVELQEYARRHGVSWIEDPSNSDTAFFRNRVRKDLLPALISAQPSFREQILELSARAATLRHDAERLAEEVSEVDDLSGELTVATEILAPLDREGLALFWPVVLARAKVVADRRGIARIAEWSGHARSGSVMPLSGGVEVLRRRRDFLVRRVQPTATGGQPLSLSGPTQVGQWRFYPIEVTTIRGRRLTSDPWQAELEAGNSPSYVVRAWLPGDRLQTDTASKPRRVARFFDDAGVSGPERKGWPVVTAGQAVVWIPGVRRGHAATARPGGPYVVYQCERNFSRSET